MVTPEPLSPLSSRHPEPRESLGVGALLRGQRRGAIVESLIHDIFHGRLVAGQRLVTQELADRFGVSHTPIREALISLGGVGLVTLEPNRGAVVRKISAREVREVCRVRRALECEAIRGACRHIDVDRLKHLRQQFTKLLTVPEQRDCAAVGKARDLDNDLHDLIARASGNQFLVQELNRLKLLFRGLRDVSWEHDSIGNGFRRVVEEAREHLAIVEALLQGRRRDALLAMSRHIRSGMIYWTRALPVTSHPPTRSASTGEQT